MSHCGVTSLELGKDPARHKTRGILHYVVASGPGAPSSLPQRGTAPAWSSSGRRWRGQFLPAPSPSLLLPPSCAAFFGRGAPSAAANRLLALALERLDVAEVALQRGSIGSENGPLWPGSAALLLQIHGSSGRHSYCDASTHDPPSRATGSTVTSSTPSSARMWSTASDPAPASQSNPVATENPRVRYDPNATRRAR